MINLLPDITLLYQWAIFIVAVFVLNFLIFRPALRIILARRQATHGDEELAAEFEKKVGQLSLRIEKSLKEARSEGHDIMVQLRQDAEHVAQDTIQAARGKMDEELQSVREKLDQESKEVEMQLKQHAQDLSSLLAQRVLGRNVS